MTTPNEDEVKYYTRRIKGLFSGNEPGLAIIVGSSEGLDGPLGTEKDTTNMSTAFDDLGFAILKETDISQDQLLGLVHAAANFPYDTVQRRCEFEAIAFYFAGHGGSDAATNKPFLQCGDQSIYIEDIVSPFYPEKTRSVPKNAKRLFFFDVCLSRVVPDTPPAAEKSTIPQLDVVPPRGNCLIAFATSLNSESAGDRRDGGYWARHLCKNIIKDMDIYRMLAETWKETVAFTSDLEGKYGEPTIQGPYITACMGPFNLKSKHV